MATTQQIIAQNNTPQIATGNPQANVNNVQPSVAPVTIPVQIQPVVQGQPQQTQMQQPQQQVQQPVQQQTQQPMQVQTPTVVQNVNQAKQMQYSFPQVNIPNEDVTGLSTYKSSYSDAINQLANSILNMRFSYNPDEDDLLQQATQYVTQNTYESMNSKGILNSSMTAERVAKVVGDLIPQYEKMAREEFEASFSRMINMANMIMDMDNRTFAIWQDARDQRWKEQEAEYEKKQKEIQNAWEKVDQLGYVDNESALILNIPAGTLSKDAREAKEQYEREVAEWTRRHEVETQTEKDLIQLKNDLAAEEWTREHRIEQEDKLRLLEYQDDIQARQETRQYKYDTALLDYKANIETQREQRQQNYEKELLDIKAQIQDAQSARDYEREKELLKEKDRLTKENAAIQQEYDKELLDIKDRIQANQDARSTANEKELLKYKSDLSSQEYANEMQIKAMYGGDSTSSSSSKNTVSLSNYDAIIKNRYATKYGDRYEIDDNDGLWNYLKTEYEAGRLSENDAWILIEKYNLQDPATRKTTATNEPKSLLARRLSGLR